jgi:hypothetical protein
MITIPAIVKAVVELQRQVAVLSNEIESLKEKEPFESPTEPVEPVRSRGRSRKVE